MTQIKLNTIQIVLLMAHYKKILIQIVNMAHICKNYMIQIKDMFKHEATWDQFSTEKYTVSLQEKHKDSCRDLERWIRSHQDAFSDYILLLLKISSFFLNFLNDFPRNIARLRILKNDFPRSGRERERSETKTRQRREILTNFWEVSRPRLEFRPTLLCAPFSMNVDNCHDPCSRIQETNV